MKNSTKRAIVLGLSFGLPMSGCATMFNGSTQNFNVVTIDDKNPEKTRCTLQNEEGTWTAAVNSSVTIHRDGNQLDVKCENDLQVGLGDEVPKFNNGYLLLDVLLDFGIISGTIDGINNSLYEYPTLTNVYMKPKKKSDL